MWVAGRMDRAALMELAGRALAPLAPHAALESAAAAADMPPDERAALLDTVLRGGGGGGGGQQVRRGRSCVVWDRRDVGGAGGAVRWAARADVGGPVRRGLLGSLSLPPSLV